MKLKFAATNLLRYTPFYPMHIGNYIRNLYFSRYLAKLPVQEYLHILDGGCGKGQYALRMAQEFPWLKVIAMDINIPKAKNNCPDNLLFRKRDLRELREKEIYDFIYSIDVLEHIPSNIEVLRNFYRALKNGGYLFLHMPYDIGKKYIFSKDFFINFSDWADKEHAGEQYTLDKMKAILTELGFEILKAEHTFGFPGELAWELDRMTDNRRFIKILLMPILKILGHIAVKSNLKAGNILVVSKKPKRIAQWQNYSVY